MTFQPNQPGGMGPSGMPQAASAIRADAQTQGAYLTQAFFWMFAGLLLSAAVATIVQFNNTLQTFAANNLIVLILGQLGLVLVIQFGIRKLNATLALGMFFVYAASVGLTIGLLIAVLYEGAAVATAFLSASAMFGGAALFGYTTKRSLASIGGYLTMAIIGLVAAMIVNIFLGNSTFDLIISIFGVGLFTVLTAYHVQRIASGDLAVWTGSVEKAAVYGALLLYLDFINLFLFLLRLFGGRR